MAMVREQDIFFVAGPAVDFALTAIRGRIAETGDRRQDTREARGFVRGRHRRVRGVRHRLSPQLLAYTALNGRPSPAADVQRKMTWYSPHALQVLVSPEHGFLFWTPLAVLALAGLVLLAAGRAPEVTPASDGRRIGACALLMVALQVYVSGAVESWTVAGAFGQRRFVCLTILLVIGLAALLSSLPPVPRRTGTVLAATGRVVEPRAHGGVQHPPDGPSAARAEEERLRCLRDDSADGPRSRVSLPHPARDLLQAATRERRGSVGVRILYFADIRFPLERANGIQTMETCSRAGGARARRRSDRAARHPHTREGSVPLLRAASRRLACGSSGPR